MNLLGITGTGHASAADAAKSLTGDDWAISIGDGRHLTVTDAEYRRIQAAGYQPTTYQWSDAAGLIVNAPDDTNRRPTAWLNIASKSQSAKKRTP